MIRALASVGRQAQALRAANRYRSELREVSGLEPGRPFREVDSGSSPAGTASHRRCGVSRRRRIG